jgi:hypothetical protein
MPANQRIGNNPAPYMKTSTGLFLNNGPYIGIVKSNTDPTRSGRIQVYLPAIGGSDPNDTNGWVTVSYASPYRGQTRQRSDLDLYIDKNSDTTTTEGYAENSFQSYGMWFTIPDLNCRVLCLFVNGDPSQGYWFACIGDSMDSHMIPAIGAVVAAADNDDPNGGYVFDPDTYATHKDLENYIEISDDSGSEIPYRLPVSEPVLMKQANSSPSTPNKVIMLPHVYQSRQLGIQGLAFDFIRGTTSASSTRECPSQVFGISTPGRLTSFANVEVSQEIVSEMQGVLSDTSGNNTSNTANTSTDNDALAKKLNCQYRTGGHQFVMDDGTIDGNDQGIRIRTTAGNEILMDDTNGQIYIINSTGNAWIELSPSGYIDIFGNSGFSVRSKGDINLHADSDVNINAGGAIKMHSGGSTKIDSGGTMAVRSTGAATVYSSGSMNIGTGGKALISGSGVDINCGSSPFNVKTSASHIPGTAGKVSDPGASSTESFTDTAQQSGTQAWWSGSGVSSVVSRLPAHEPWSDHEIDGIKTSAVVYEEAGSDGINRIQSGTTRTGVRGSKRGPNITQADIDAQVASGTICSLTLKETKAMLAAICRLESYIVSSPSNPGNKGRSMSTNPPKIGTNGKNYTNSGGTGIFSCNSGAYLGKYQFGAAALIQSGFMRAGSSGSSQGQKITNSANWKGIYGITSAEKFLSSIQAQEAAMMVYMNYLCKQIPSKLKSAMLSSSDGHAQIGAYLSIMHMLGNGAAQNYFVTHINTHTGVGTTRGISSDGNGQSASSRWPPVFSAVLSVKGK